MNQPRSAIVVGCGVSGLTSAIRLIEAGFSVEIVARDLPPETTSNVAAALWFPFRAEPRDRVLAWSKTTFDELVRQHQTGVPGVTMTTFIELYDHEAPRPFWEPAAVGVRRARPDELHTDYTMGWAAEVPIVETPAYLPFLMERFASLGGTIRQREVHSLAELTAPDRIVVNCTGLGARELLNDEEVFPIRGQVVRVTNPGIRRALTDDEGPRSIAYTIPRTDDIILGGIAVPNDWNRTPDPELSNEILKKCRELEPALVDATVIETRVGLRPGRTTVRLERETLADGATVIHNYGHGGAGFTLCWGCAAEVAERAVSG
jgi:D-amino-acid oxidase